MTDKKHKGNSPFEAAPLFVKATPKFKARLKAVASAVEKDMSEFTRDALNEKIDELARENAAIAKAVREAEKAA
jgi:predicted transcriptional regulator